MATRVYDICEEKLDRESILRHATQAANNVLCIDGTSATKKTTILNSVGCDVGKIQKLAKFKNINRYFPAMLGYISTGISSFKYGNAMRLNDRSPLNPLEWHVLWCCMSDFYTKHGNIYPSDMTFYERIFKNLKDSFFYERFSAKINCIAFVDSNCARCDGLRRARNEGSDRERSNWKFYTPMQNAMYSVLHSGRVIDMAWFDEYSIDETSLGISTWIKDLLRDMSSLTIDRYVPMKRHNLPINFPETDYSLANMTTHVYRSIGRIGCKILANEIDKKNVAAVLANNYLPQYVSVESIQVPLSAIMHQSKFNITGAYGKYQVPESCELPSSSSWSTSTSTLSAIRMDCNEDDGDFKECEFF